MFMSFGVTAQLDFNIDTTEVNDEQFDLRVPQQ